MTGPAGCRFRAQLQYQYPVPDFQEDLSSCCVMLQIRFILFLFGKLSRWFLWLFFCCFSESFYLFECQGRSLFIFWNLDVSFSILDIWPPSAIKNFNCRVFIKGLD